MTTEIDSKAESTHFKTEASFSVRLLVMIKFVSRLFVLFTLFFSGQAMRPVQLKVFDIV